MMKFTLVWVMKHPLYLWVIGNNDADNYDDGDELHPTL